jgi:hypothetical protein
MAISIIIPLPNGGRRHKYTNGDELWYLNGARHRDDGPAVIFNGLVEWHLYGVKLSCKTQEQFERLMRLKAFW